MVKYFSETPRIQDIKKILYCLFKDNLKTVMKKDAIAREELFDSLNLPEEFVIKDYRKALEEKGIKISNNTILYGDMLQLQKEGKVAIFEKKRRGISIFKIIKKEQNCRKYEQETKMNKIEEDDIDKMPEEPGSCGIKSPSDHRLMFKTLESKLRRMVVKSIGEHGKTKEDIMKEVVITESQLNFQLDYLIKECYAETDGKIFRLNDKGKDELLVNINLPKN